MFVKHVLCADLERRAFHCDCVDPVAVFFNGHAEFVEVLRVVEEALPDFWGHGGAFEAECVEKLLAEGRRDPCLAAYESTDVGAR